MKHKPMPRRKRGTGADRVQLKVYIDKQLHAALRRYSKRRRQSMSALIEAHLEAVTGGF